MIGAALTFVWVILYLISTTAGWFPSLFLSIPMFPLFVVLSVFPSLKHLSIGGSNNVLVVYVSALIFSMIFWFIISSFVGVLVRSIKSHMTRPNRSL